MSQAGRFREFVNRNLVSIVCIPGLIMLHWGWSKLQNMEVLVTPAERRDLPLFEGAKYIEEKIEEKIESWKKKE